MSVCETAAHVGGSQEKCLQKNTHLRIEDGTSFLSTTTTMWRQFKTQKNIQCSTKGPGKIFRIYEEVME